MQKTITLEQIIEKLNKKEEKKVKVTHVEVEEYGLIEFTRPNDNDILQYFSDVTKAIEFDDNEETKDKKVKTIDFRKMLDISSEFVYKCCPMLQKKEIRDMFPKVSYYEIPIQVFGMNETIELAGKLNDIFEGSNKLEKTQEEIKN